MNKKHALFLRLHAGGQKAVGGLFLRCPLLFVSMYLVPLSVKSPLRSLFRAELTVAPLPCHSDTGLLLNKASQPVTLGHVTNSGLSVFWLCLCCSFLVCLDFLSPLLEILLMGCFSPTTLRSSLFLFSSLLQTVHPEPLAASSYTPLVTSFPLHLIDRASKRLQLQRLAVPRQGSRASFRQAQQQGPQSSSASGPSGGVLRHASLDELPEGSAASPVVPGAGSRASGDVGAPQDRIGHPCGNQSMSMQRGTERRGNERNGENREGGSKATSSEEKTAIPTIDSEQTEQNGDKDSLSGAVCSLFSPVSWALLLVARLQCCSIAARTFHLMERCTVGGFAGSSKLISGMALLAACGRGGSEGEGTAVTSEPSSPLLLPPTSASPASASASGVVYSSASLPASSLSASSWGGNQSGTPAPPSLWPREWHRETLRMLVDLLCVAHDLLFVTALSDTAERGDVTERKPPAWKKGTRTERGECTRQRSCECSFETTECCTDDEVTPRCPVRRGVNDNPTRCDQSGPCEARTCSASRRGERPCSAAGKPLSPLVPEEKKDGLVPFVTPVVAFDYLGSFVQPLWDTRTRGQPLSTEEAGASSPCGACRFDVLPFAGSVPVPESTAAQVDSLVSSCSSSFPASTSSALVSLLTCMTCPLRTRAELEPASPCHARHLEETWLIPFCVPRPRAISDGSSPQNRRHRAAPQGPQEGVSLSVPVAGLPEGVSRSLVFTCDSQFPPVLGAAPWSPAKTRTIEEKEKAMTSSVSPSCWRGVTAASPAGLGQGEAARTLENGGLGAGSYSEVFLPCPPPDTSSVPKMLEEGSATSSFPPVSLHYLVNLCRLELVVERATLGGVDVTLAIRGLIFLGANVFLHLPGERGLWSKVLQWGLRAEDARRLRRLGAVRRQPGSEWEKKSESEVPTPKAAVGSSGNGEKEYLEKLTMSRSSEESATGESAGHFAEECEEAGTASEWERLRKLSEEGREGRENAASAMLGGHLTIAYSVVRAVNGDVVSREFVDFPPGCVVFITPFPPFWLTRVFLVWDIMRVFSLARTQEARCRAAESSGETGNACCWAEEEQSQVGKRMKKREAESENSREEPSPEHKKETEVSGASGDEFNAASLECRDRAVPDAGRSRAARTMGGAEHELRNTVYSPEDTLHSRREKKGSLRRVPGEEGREENSAASESEALQGKSNPSRTSRDSSKSTDVTDVIYDFLSVIPLNAGRSSGTAASWTEYGTGARLKQSCGNEHARDPDSKLAKLSGLETCERADPDAHHPSPRGQFPTCSASPAFARSADATSYVFEPSASSVSAYSNRPALVTRHLRNLRELILRSVVEAAVRAHYWPVFPGSVDLTASCFSHTSASDFSPSSRGRVEASPRETVSSRERPGDDVDECSPLLRNRTHGGGRAHARVRIWVRRRKSFHSMLGVFQGPHGFADDAGYGKMPDQRS